MSTECRGGDCDQCNDPHCQHLCHRDPTQDTTAYWPEEDHVRALLASGQPTDVDQAYRDGYRTGHQHGYNKGRIEAAR